MEVVCLNNYNTCINATKTVPSLTGHFSGVRVPTFPLARLSQAEPRWDP